MTGIVVTPPRYPLVQGPLVFLAGPIQGASNWQQDAILCLRALCPAVNLASPRRSYLPGEFDYGAQVDWETHHLRLAAERGAILFWLAAEMEHRCDRSYAQTSRFELAEWKIRHERDGVRLIVGIEKGFSGARYIRRRFGQDCPSIQIVDSLEAACRSTIQAVYA